MELLAIVISISVTFIDVPDPFDTEPKRTRRGDSTVLQLCLVHFCQRHRGVGQNDTPSFLDFCSCSDHDRKK